MRLISFYGFGSCLLIGFLMGGRGLVLVVGFLRGGGGGSVDLLILFGTVAF